MSTKREGFGRAVAQKNHRRNFHPFRRNFSRSPLGGITCTTSRPRSTLPAMATCVARKWGSRASPPWETAPIFRRFVPLTRRHEPQFMGSTRIVLNAVSWGIPIAFAHISLPYTHTGRTPRTRKNAQLTRITRKSQ